MLIFMLVFFIIIFLFFKNRNKNIKSFSSNSMENNNISKLTKEGYLVFLNWANGKEIFNASEYPRYFYYDYNIEDCNELHKNLIQNGFLKKSSLKEYLNSKTISELKQILNENNLKKTGKKSEIINRILLEVNPNKIKIEKTFYSLTEKGAKIIEENNYIIKLAKMNISLEEFEIAKKEKEDLYSFEDVVYSILEKKGLEFFHNKDYGLYRNTLLDIAILFKKDNNLKKELEYLLKVTYCDLSGNSNDGLIDDKELIFIPMAKRISDLKEYYSIDLLEECYKIKFPFHYCSKEIFGNIINEILKGENSDILKKYLPKMKEKV